MCLFGVINNSQFQVANNVQYVFLCNVSALMNKTAHYWSLKATEFMTVTWLGPTNLFKYLALPACGAGSIKRYGVCPSDPFTHCNSMQWVCCCWPNRKEQWVCCCWPNRKEISIKCCSNSRQCHIVDVCSWTQTYNLYNEATPWIRRMQKMKTLH